MKRDKLLLVRVLVVLGVAAEAASQLALFVSPTVDVEGGKLRGKYVLTREGKKTRAFLGIPYAKPPVDNLRFRSPEPVEPWSHDRLAMDHPKPCLQPERRHGAPTGREDCLYLNLYTPDKLPKPQNRSTQTQPAKTEAENTGEDKTNDDIKTNAIPLNGTDVSSSDAPTPAANQTSSNSTAAHSNNNEHLLPVMVFFHGGAFEMGHSEPFSHEYLLDNNVIIVTVQYRLGILGFLSTGDEVLPGNLGLKDQRLALQWVKNNIANFGGCPEKITIFGDGVGGASVHYHMLFTPLRNATFRAGISMSGTALSPWAFRPPSEVTHLADRVAALAGCPRESLALVHCLREKRAEDLVDILHKYKNESRDGCGEWVHALPVLGAVLENATSVPDAFVTTSPWDKKVALPWIVGVTSKELLYEFTPHLVDRKDKLFKELDKCFNETLPKVLGYQFSNASGAELAAAVRSFYFDNQPLGRDHFADIIDAVSDGSVVYPAFEAVRRAGRKTTWLYHFDYLGSNTFGPSALDGRIAPGRGDDLFYFFPRPLGKNVPRKTKEADTVMSRKLIKLWLNFATHLDPTPEEVEGLTWAPTTPSTTFLNISQTNMTVDRPFLANRMNFWSLQDYPYRDDDYRHEYAPASSTVTSLFGSLPMSMELAPVSADRMADILHTLRTTKYEVKGPAENATETLITPSMLLEANNLTLDEVANIIQNFRVSEASDVSDLNMLRYAVMGHQQSAQHSADVAQDTLVNMAGFFHTLRMARPDDSDDLALPVPVEVTDPAPLVEPVSVKLVRRMGSDG